MDTSSEERATHPRLYFGVDDLEALRQKRQADPVAVAAWARILDAARQGMELPLPKWEPRWEYDKGESGHASMGDVLGQAATAAANLAFVIPPDRREGPCAKGSRPDDLCLRRRLLDVSSLLPTPL